MILTLLLAGLGVLLVFALAANLAWKAESPLPESGSRRARDSSGPSDGGSSSYDAGLGDCGSAAGDCGGGGDGGGGGD
jgi:hypothetical protein